MTFLFSPPYDIITWAGHAGAGWLAGKITNNFYDKKFKEPAGKQSGLMEKTSRRDKADK